MVKKCEKEIVDIRFNEESNGSKVGIFQSTRQTNIDTGESFLSTIRKGKRYITNTLIRATRKEKPSNITKIYNLNKSLLSKYTKVTIRTIICGFQMPDLLISAGLACSNISSFLSECT